MQSLESILSVHITSAIENLFGSKIDPKTISFSKTNPQFEGDITIVVFPWVKLAGKGPEQTGQLIGEYLTLNVEEVKSHNVVKGFLNIVMTDAFWKNQFAGILKTDNFGTKELTPSAPFVMVEYSSPNTNKPLHLGHVRNNLLGYSVSEILKADGNKVMKVNLVNDRGIHICKSMLAWQKFGNGETPESSALKGDHLVGKYYVIYSQKEKEESFEIQHQFHKIMSLLNDNGDSIETFSYINKCLLEDSELFKNQLLQQELMSRTIPEYFEVFPSYLKQSIKNFISNIHDSLFFQVKEMLQKWEAGDKEVKELWAKMNGWVYDGFAQSYKKLGVDFDKIYYESNTYILGKEIIEEGLNKNVFVKRPDGAVIIDLTAEKLDEKVLLRSDGTSVYMTQDLGTAVERHKEFPFEKLIYVVGNEQEYHFKVLKITLQKLGYKFSDGLFHLSYGMVELPEGKMKSREGTVVDADDLIAKMEQEAGLLSEEKGLVEGMSENERADLAHMIGMAALKYFILKVDPKKKMLFDPKESIDLHGNTGPFIQYTHARIRSIWKKSELKEVPALDLSVAIHPKERELIRELFGFPAAVADAAKDLSPALIANYTYDLAKTFNQFYDVCPVLKEEDASLRNFRLALSYSVARTIKSAFKMLGIDVPERM